MTLGAFLVGVIVLVGVRLLVPTFKYLRNGQARQQADIQARICMETITRVMSNGRASTLVISSPATTPAVPLSQVQFTGVDGAAYTIAWSTAPLNTVKLQRTPPGGATTTTTVLATHVVGLHFTPPATQDPGLVYVTLRMIVPLDSTGSSGSLYTIFFPNQTVRMIAS